MRTDLLIIGAGPAGLVHGFWRKQDNPDQDLRVVDRSQEPGGRVQTRRIEGYSCEWGPEGFRPNEQSDALIEALEMEGRVTPCRDGAKLRWVARDGILHPLPMGPGELRRSKLFSLVGKLRLLTELFRRRRSPAGETLAQFVRRRFGRQAVPLAEAMASGVFGGDAHRLEMAAAFPKVLELEQEHGSLLKALGAMAKERKQHGGTPRAALCTFKTGMEELIQALRNRLANNLLLGREVVHLARTRYGWSAMLGGESGTTIDAQQVVIAVPAHTAALLLADTDADLAAELRAIPFCDIANVHLGFSRSDAEDKLRGFGFLIDRREQSPYLGAIYSSALFSGRTTDDTFLVRIMAGGALHRGFLDRDEDVIAREAEQLLRRYTGLTAPLRFHRVTKLENAIPQYIDGHCERVRRIEQLAARHEGLRLIGNSYHDVSMVGQLSR